MINFSGRDYTSARTFSGIKNTVGERKAVCIPVNDTFTMTKNNALPSEVTLCMEDGSTKQLMNNKTTNEQNLEDKKVFMDGFCLVKGLEFSKSSFDGFGLNGPSAVENGIVTLTGVKISSDIQVPKFISLQ